MNAAGVLGGKRRMFYKTLNLQFLAPDNGAEGGSYYVDPEQFGNLTFDEDEVPEPHDELESNEEEVQDSEEENIEDEEVETEEQEVEQESEEERLAGLRQADYSRKTQALAEEKRAFEAEKQSFEMQIREQIQSELESQYEPYKQLDALIAQNPQLEEQILGLLQNAGVSQTPQKLTQDPQIQAMQEQFKQMQEQLQNFKAMEMQREIQAEWNDLFAKYPDAKNMQEELAKFADENGVNLLNAYKLYNYDNVKKNTQTEMVKNQMRRKPANTLKSTGQTGANEPVSKPQGYNQIADFLRGKSINLTD